MSYVICIPSYKRGQVCNKKTLSMLKKHNIPKSLIHVYVANQEEYDEYKIILDPALYHKLIVGKIGLVPQRQFISEQWPDKKNIVFFDDDIQSVDLTMSEFKNRKLHDFFLHAFSECKKQKSFIWGVYPVFNPFFRKGRREVTTSQSYVVGAFYGIINRPTLKSIQLTLTKGNGQKEDVERTIKYFLEDGIVLRFNKIAFVTKYYGKDGGLGTFEDRLKPMLEASKLLKKKYPEYGDVTTKKNGMTEFRLKKIPSKYEIDETNRENTRKKKSSFNKTQKKRTEQ